MFTRIYKYSSLLLCALLLMAGCKKLDDINHDPTKPTSTEPPYLLTGAEKSSMDILYSTLQNGYMGMQFAQYWTGNSRVADAQYSIDEGNNNALWTALYSALHNLNLIITTNNARGTNPAAQNQNAIAGILKVWLFQILTDTYVNVPFTDALKETAKITPTYDDAKTMYNGLADTLQAQIDMLDASQPTFDEADNIFAGDVTKWTKLAHSLMLRIAIRMADVDAAKAQSLIEAHYQAAMTSNDDDAEFTYLNATPNRFPMDETERAIIDFFVSGTLVDYMKSINDPRLEIYARPAPEGDSIKGMPYGWSQADSARPSISLFSYPGTRIYSSQMKGTLMNYSEVAFTLAEAAARGYAVGSDAATYYEAGIRASMAYWGVTTGVDEYIAGVPYNADDWRNVIGTQKWLALYGQGFEAWFERLRLNFTKPGGAPLFIAPYSGSLDQNVTVVPFRLTYPNGESNNNNANYLAASSAIGGDTKGTKNWWINY